MIYFIEDDDNIRKLVCYALSKEGMETKGFSVPIEFWKSINVQKPELILLDIMLPGEDGLTILKKLKASAETEDIPVIMLTAKSGEIDKVTGLDLGADDYIAKPFGMTELVSRVKAVMRRYNKNKSKKLLYNMGNLRVDIEKHTVTVSEEEILLSYKEFSLLEVLLAAEGKVVKRGELLESVWGEFYEESRTLDVHIRKLRVKLGDAGAYIKTIKNLGYRIGDANE